MSRKLQNTLALVGVLIILAILGFGYIFFFQKSSITEREKELEDLKTYSYDPALLNEQLQEKIKRAAELDSILAARKYNIPMYLDMLKFYNFLNDNLSRVSKETKINVEYIQQIAEKDFFYHEYKITGTGTFNDLYQIIYFIEQSRELKKITELKISNFVLTQENTPPKFLVAFSFNVKVYYSTNDLFMTSGTFEHNLTANRVYDSFFPLIRTDIPPNYEGLLDVQQGARLLAIIPEGAFISDVKGDSYLLMEGDAVYLGYLTKIDQQNRLVRFVLNKGGIVESVELKLEKEINRQTGR